MGSAKKQIRKKRSAKQKFGKPCIKQFFIKGIASKFGLFFSMLLFTCCASVRKSVNAIVLKNYA